MFQDLVFVSSLFLSICMLAVVYYDTRYYLIPNWLNLLLLAAFPVWAWIVLPEPEWLMRVSMFGILFAVGFALFSLRIMGGGDVKLLAVLGLYTGLNETGLALVVYMAVLGGVLSLVVLALRMLLPAFRLKRIPTLFTMGQPIPYGLAIAGAFLFLIWSGRLMPVVG